MKNIVKISSLGLVALLASCNNSATPLKKIDPATALAVAQSISSSQSITKNKKLNKNPEMGQNVLFSGDYFPYTATSMSADITIHNVSKMQMSGMFPTNEDEETVIKKHIYFNMEDLFYHAHISMTHTSNDPIKVTYPDVDYYFFFIEDKEQDEETVKTEYDKIGTYYELTNVGNLMKMMVVNDSGVTKGECTQYFCELFEDSNPIDNNALSYTLVSPITNWNVMEAIYQSVGGSEFSGSSSKMLIMNAWLYNYFGDIVYEFEDFRDRMKALEDENSYFNYAFRSNNASSLGIEADARQRINETQEGTTITGYTQETTSLTFRDLYLSECRFTINNEANTNIKVGDIEINTYSSSTTSCDQYIKYNTKESDTYPSDYLDYNPGI